MIREADRRGWEGNVVPRFDFARLSKREGGVPKNSHVYSKRVKQARVNQKRESYRTKRPKNTERRGLHSIPHSSLRLLHRLHPLIRSKPALSLHRLLTSSSNRLPLLRHRRWGQSPPLLLLGRTFLLRGAKSIEEGGRGRSGGWCDWCGWGEEKTGGWVREGRVGGIFRGEEGGEGEVVVDAFAAAVAKQRG